MGSNIEIRPQSKRNGLTLCVLGSIGLLLGSLIYGGNNHQLNIVMVFFLGLSTVVLLVGALKLRQAKISLLISKDKITHYHHKGSWHLLWENIARVDIPVIRQGLEHTPLPFVGIRIRHYEPFLNKLSPRLAASLLMQQRALTLHNNECDSGTCYSDSLLENDKFKGDSGTVYTGILAMFAHRMLRLRNNMGLDLYIEQSELDRSPEAFVQLMKQCQEHANY